MTTRTIAAFHQDALREFADGNDFRSPFIASEAARHDLADDPTHEGRCDNWSRTLRDRFYSCVALAVYDQHQEDYIDNEDLSDSGISSHQAGSFAVINANQIASNAVQVFGHAVSLEREQAVSRHAKGLTPTNSLASFQALKGTFADIVVSQEDGRSTLLIQDELPRHLLVSEDVRLDAPVLGTANALTLVFTNILQANDTGDFIHVDSPDDAIVGNKKLVFNHQWYADYAVTKASSEGPNEKVQVQETGGRGETLTNAAVKSAKTTYTAVPGEVSRELTGFTLVISKEERDVE